LCHKGSIIRAIAQRTSADVSPICPLSGQDDEDKETDEGNSASRSRERRVGTVSPPLPFVESRMGR